MSTLGLKPAGCKKDYLLDGVVDFRKAYGGKPSKSDGERERDISKSPNGSVFESVG